MPYTIYEKAGSDAAVAAALAALPPGGDSLPANAAGVLTNDGSGVLSWEAAPASSLDTEGVQDIVGSMVTGAGGSYDDAAGTITLPSSGGGGVPFPFPFTIAPVVGEYLPVFASGTHTNFACTAGRLLPCPVYAHEAMNVDAVALQVDSGVAGATVELALYTWGGGITSTLVATLGTVDVSTGGLKVATFAARPLDAGLHVVVARPSATVTLWGVSGGIMVRDNSPGGGTQRFRFPHAAGGSMPATINWNFNAGVSGNNFPKLQLRRSA